MKKLDFLLFHIIMANVSLIDNTLWYQILEAVKWNEEKALMVSGS